MDKFYRLCLLLRRTMHFFLNICAATVSHSPGKLFPAAFFLAALWLSLPSCGISSQALKEDSIRAEKTVADSIPQTQLSAQQGKSSTTRDSVLSNLARAGSTQPIQFSDRKPEKILSLRNISYVLIVIGLLILFLHFLRKFVNRPVGPASAGEHFQVLQQFHLGPKKSISLVKIYDRLLFLGVTETTITTLLEITGEEEVEQILAQLDDSRKERQTNFREIYQGLLSRFKK